MLKKNKVLIVFLFFLIATFSMDLYMNWHLTENRQDIRLASAPIEKSPVPSIAKVVSKLDSTLSTSSNIKTVEAGQNTKKKKINRGADENKTAESNAVEKGMLVCYNRTQLIVEVRISSTKEIKQSNILEPSKQISVLLPLGIYNIQVFDSQKNIISTGEVELKDTLGEVYYVKM